MISVIVPIHNSIKYIKKCIGSILQSDYTDIEVICIDSGNDGCGDYLKELSRIDHRIRYFWDANNSYGYKINFGINLSEAEYICIVDSDDYIEKNMYSRLVDTITLMGTDFVKCDYSNFYADQSRGCVVYEHESSVGDREKYNRIINPSLEPEILLTSNGCIWCGIYKKSFLIDNNIVLHESPGASFQDTGFSVLTLLYAAKVYYIDDALYNYRRDNPGSSFKSNSKVYTIKEEWDWIDYQIRKRKLAYPDQLYFLTKRKIHNYGWNIDRLSPIESLEFSEAAKKEYICSLNNSQKEFAFEKLCFDAEEIQIYGCGRWGMRIFEYLSSLGIKEKVSSFIVSGTVETEIISSIPVRSIKSGYIPPKDALTIVAIKGEAGKEVYRTLISSYACKSVLIDNKINDYVHSALKRYEAFHLKTAARSDILTGIRNYSFIRLSRIFVKNENARGLFIGMKHEDDRSSDSFHDYTEFYGTEYKSGDSKGYAYVFINSLPLDRDACKKLISDCSGLAKEDGRLFILADNRLGLDALCNISEQRPDGYTRNELKALLNSCGIRSNRFYSVFPGRILPQLMLSEDKKANEDIALRYTQMFCYPEDSMKSETELYRLLDSNSDIHSFAPLYFIECSFSESLSDIDQVSLTMHRDPKHATYTVVRGDTVEKIRGYDSGNLLELKKNLAELSDAGLKTVKILGADAESIVMEKIDGVTGDIYLRKVLLQDKNRFEKEFDRFVQLIVSSSETVQDPDLGLILKHGYPDLIPLNTIVSDGEFVIIDQEYRQENLPVCMVVYRSIRSLYAGHPECEKAYSESCLYRKYGLDKKIGLWKEYSDTFKKKLYGDAEYRLFTAIYTPREDNIARNQMMLKEISSNNTFCNRHAPYGLLSHKPYKIGYCAGVFDVFHVGHLNLLKSAKEMCDYLIVGVVRDQDCENVKHKKPLIPLDERMEIVKGCRYADKVVVIPSNARSSIDAFNMYHFDVQFSGSDYENDPYWLSMRDKLRQLGSDMIFFPYTQKTSSSNIRERIISSDDK